MDKIAETPAPPYYAVIFTSVKSGNAEGYASTAARMMELASQQEGYLGVESAVAEIGITVSYWSSLEAIRNWKAQAEHLQAQQRGREQWYSNYTTRIALVEREYDKQRSVYQ